MENGGRKIVGEGARFSDLRVICKKLYLIYVIYNVKNLFENYNTF